MSRFFDDRLDALEAYTPGEQPKVEGLIKLNTNEYPYPPSPKVLAAIAREKDFRLYPDPTAADLVQAIADYYGLRREEVIVGNGSDEILAFAFLAYGRQICYPAISYGFYPVFTQLFRCRGKALDLTESLEVDLEAFRREEGTILLANPNAPTGFALSRDTIEGLLRDCPDRLLIVDEAYVDFGGESAIPLIERFDNLLVIQTMSKSRSLAGMRIGMAMGQEELIRDLNRIKYSFNPYNLSREALAAGVAAMEDREYFEACRREIMECREWFTEELRSLGVEVLPSAANFVFAKIGADFYSAMRERGILLRHFDKEPIRDYVRITIGKREQMETLLAAAKEYFEKA